jgi:hypothetical protein
VPKKTKKNPYGLTGKQLLVIEDMVAKVKQGKSITPVESTRKIYDATEDSSRTITYRNLAKPDFRNALIDSLHQKGVLGLEGRLENRLVEGLDATDEKGEVDFTNRLKYIQEINKISGVYAPQRIEKKSISFNTDLSEDELDDKIRELQEELEDR